MTRGRSGGRSIVTVWRPPPERKVVRARSTRNATSVGSGETESVPASMRPASSRSAISPIVRSACSSTMRMNSRVSASENCRPVPSSAAVEPLIAASGVRSSWLTMLRNSARMRSSSSRGARSCMVTTTDATVPSSAWIGVALTSVVTLRPSGVASTISSARTVSALLSALASGSRSRAISRPSAKRQVRIPSRSSADWPGLHRLSTMRLASRLIETARPVRTSNTTTPTGEVSISASRSARARCSAR